MPSSASERRQRPGAGCKHTVKCNFEHGDPILPSSTEGAPWHSPGLPESTAEPVPGSCRDSLKLVLLRPEDRRKTNICICRYRFRCERLQPLAQQPPPFKQFQARSHASPRCQTTLGGAAPAESLERPPPSENRARLSEFHCICETPIVPSSLYSRP